VVGKLFPHTDEWLSMTMAPDGHTIFLSGKAPGDVPGSHEIVPVSTVTGAMETPIQIPSYPLGMYIAPDGQTAYVLTAGNADLTPVNLVTRVIGTPIPVPGGVQDLAFAPGDTMAYFVSAGSLGEGDISYGFVYPIDLPSGVVGPPMRFRFQPNSIVISSDGRTAYVTDGLGVRFVDLATGKVTLTIRLPGGAHHIAMAPR
jgi:DNA-binding beta-propeller fold protein YncE